MLVMSMGYCLMRWPGNSLLFCRRRKRRSEATDRRLANLRVALGLLQLPPRAPELRLPHQWLDTWTGLGSVVVGVERPGLRFSLSHIAEGERRAFAPACHPSFICASAPPSAITISANPTMNSGCGR
jgi:hypothetical protein